MRCKSPLLVFLMSFVLVGCSTQSGGWRMPDMTAPQNQQNAQMQEPIQQNTVALRLGLLVPMSGPSAPLGDALLNAAQMALVDLNATSTEIIPKDTGTTPTLAAAAARDANLENVNALIGPVFADATRAVSSAASIVPIVSLSTDVSVANNKVLVMGILPELQAVQIVDFAAAKGLRNFAVLVSNDDYGRLVGDAFVNRARTRGLTVTQIVRLPQSPAAIDQAIRSFAQNPQPIEAVFMPLPAATARAVSDTLSRVGMTPDKVRRIGTALWEDPALASWPALQGAWFAAPDPSNRARFENKYAATYGAKPPRIASLGYDATALMIAASRAGLVNGYIDRAALLNPNGFLGTDGIFRFRANGTIERGLAVQEFSQGQIITIAPAPQSFVAPNG